MTRPELAKALGRKSRDIRKPLERLLLHRILYKVDDAVTLSSAWKEALEHAATVTGAHASKKRQRAAHVAERAAFRGRLSSPDTTILKEVGYSKAA